MENMTEIIQAISEATKGKLAREEKATLGFMLYEAIKDRETEKKKETKYEGAVDFLMMCWRIDLEDRNRLIKLHNREDKKQ